MVKVSSWGWIDWQRLQTAGLSALQDIFFQKDKYIIDKFLPFQMPSLSHPSVSARNRFSCIFSFQTNFSWIHFSSLQIGNMLEMAVGPPDFLLTCWHDVISFLETKALYVFGGAVDQWSALTSHGNKVPCEGLAHSSLALCGGLLPPAPLQRMFHAQDIFGCVIWLYEENKDPVLMQAQNDALHETTAEVCEKVLLATVPFQHIRIVPVAALSWGLTKASNIDVHNVMWNFTGRKNLASNRSVECGFLPLDAFEDLQSLLLQSPSAPGMKCAHCDVKTKTSKLKGR